MPIKVIGIDNSVTFRSKVGQNFTLIVNDNNNIVEIGKGCTLTNTHISIIDNNYHSIIYYADCFMGPRKVVLEGNATVSFGKNCGIRGVELCVKSGRIEIGELTMTSSGIVVRNNDSHRVFNDEGVITNPPRDIKIGRHVWTCKNSSILKGREIGDDSIVAFGTVATNGCPPHSIISDKPGKIV